MGERFVRLEPNIYKVLHKGRWRFRVMVMSPGGIRRQRLCGSMVEARRVKAMWLAGLDVPSAAEQAGEVPSDHHVATLADAIRHAELDLGQRGKSGVRTSQVAVVLTKMWPELLAMPVSSVTVDLLMQYRVRREKAGKAAGTIIRDMRVLRAVLKKARPEFVLPVAAMPAEDFNRVRWLTPADEALVFTLLQEPFRGMCRLAAVSFMRQAEVRTLRRGYVHLDQGMILLPRAKGGPRAVVLNDEAVRILEAQMGFHQHDLVFPNRDGKAYSRVHVSRVWRKASRQAGLQDFRFHDLRHHAATVALSNRATNQHLKALGGWKSDKMISRYAHVLDPQLRAISEGISKGVRMVDRE